MGKVNGWALEMPHLDRPLWPWWGRGDGKGGELTGRIWHAEGRTDAVCFAKGGLQGPHGALVSQLV